MKAMLIVVFVNVALSSFANASGFVWSEDNPRGCFMASADGDIMDTEVDAENCITRYVWFDDDGMSLNYGGMRGCWGVAANGEEIKAVSDSLCQ